MTVKPEDILPVASPDIGPLESSYLPAIFLGFGTTLRHFVTSFGQGRTNRVMQYPEVRREHFPASVSGFERANFRGVHRLNRDEAGRVKCVACMMCPTLCPANCIHIEADTAPWDDREKYPKKFEIDELRCIYCGMCEEACPVDAIELTPEYDVVGYTRQEMVFDKAKLLNVYDVTIGNKPM